MLFPQKRRPAPLYFSSAAHCILYFDKDLAHKGCFRSTSSASAVGLVAANDSLFPANHSLAAANDSLVAANNEELRRQPLFLYLLPRIPKGLPSIVSMCYRPLLYSFVEKALACGSALRASIKNASAALIEQAAAYFIRIRRLRLEFYVCSAA